MDEFWPPTREQRLFRSLMMFKRASWHHQQQHSMTGCKPSEFRALFFIKRGAKPGQPTMKVSEISKMLHVTSPTVTQMLNNLEALGLVERHVDAADRRAVGVKLTEKGEMAAQRAADEMSASIRGLVEYLGEEQSDQLTDLLSKATRYFIENQASAAHQFPWNGEEEV